MCGLAALFGTGNQPLPSIQAMLDVIRHRGPDDEGWVAFEGGNLAATCGGGADTPTVCYAADLPYAPVSGTTVPEGARVALGHRRLSILDVSPGGHQPMSYGGGRYWIVFNGEIYNHPELRRELEASGHRFVSRSDTEVLLAAYAEWGSGCLARLEGMFAFVLVDRVEATLFAARDRFGIKPLYYWVAPDRCLAFASEIKQFSVLPGWRAVVNGQRAYDFLAWGILDHTDETMFRGVYQLRPGTSVRIDLKQPPAAAPAGRLVQHEWYRLAGSPFTGGLEEAASGFRERFEASVRAHLQADVPVGSCLSGGLDSSSVVCVMNELLRQGGVQERQHAFSSCSAIARFDEREYVEEVVRHTGVEAHCVYPDLARLFDELDRITWHQDEPFGSTSIFAQWSVFALAADSGVKVMLDGQGADEQLAGYQGYHGALYASLFRQLRWIELWREIRAAKQMHGHGPLWAMKYLADALLPDALRYPLRAMIGTETAASAWLDLDLLGAEPLNPYHGEEGAALSIAELSYRQLTKSNLQMLLHWEDRDSMAHSIEARVPFLDHRLVEFVLGLPDQFKIHRGVTKRVLREGLRGVLPEAIRMRMSKLGFATPEEHWIRVEAPERFRKALKTAVDQSHGILHPRALSYLEDVITGQRVFSFLPWRMISFGAWMDCYGVKPT
ncbi:asparagine synthase (glutamine-hydrolyzing) [Tepidimonas taiwanensis]|uniref:asparagine synthase (glutamine-hydrolyzing) n=1 Tax=Tepidimonas taiwanensis TaxID=307486 RepID=UPI0005BAEA03|nr:asparagine synthase (glutamine-hydrolyzing) [Tepidimonas taiwanensis]